MATKMTPLMFAQKYFDMDVFFYPQDLAGGMAAYVPPKGWKRLRADNYRLGSSHWKDIFWRQDIAPRFTKPVTVTVKSISGMIEDVEFRTAADAHRHFGPPFVGKGFT